MNYKPIIFIVLMIGCLSMFQYSLYRHEQIHETIFLVDGCQNPKIDLGLFIGKTYCLDENYIMSSESIGRHIDNEIVGYNSDHTNGFIVLAVLLLGINLFNDDKKEEKIK